MSADLLQIVHATSLTTDEITARTNRIRTATISASAYINAPNFTLIHPLDLQFLFFEYDREFFRDAIAQTLGDTPLRFRLSKRMTSSGGKTTKFVDRRDGSRRFEICISTALLFNCFHGDDHRPMSCSGILCRDRLDALQRVMEHEIVHLIEELLWDKSSCAKPQFHSISRRFFGHTDNTHQLITPREKAAAQYGIRPGLKVQFRFDGVEHTGVVNRVNKRATVLVEDRNGQRYSDGKRYTKFYVPIRLLKRAP